jgi:DNA polymerase-3 subunit chi
VTEVAFYQLGAMPLERALPRLLERALGAGYRVVVLAGSQERVDHLDAVLWTYDDASFLPHGTARDGEAERQPIWLTVADENPNGATMLVLVDGTMSERLGEYRRCLDIFDAGEESVAAARDRWRRAKAAGHAVTYWQQGERGWEQKA